MPKPLDDGSPSLVPHGDTLKTPGGHRPREKEPGDIPPKPSQPLPFPENPDVPPEPAEPAEPGQGQPIPPELDTTKPRL